MDNESEPELAYIDILEAVVEPGDVLFVPSFLWHCVSSLSPSLTVGRRWFSMSSALRGSPMMTALMATATRPTAIQALWGARLGRAEGFFR